MRIVNAGVIKNDWQLDTNTGTFIDKVNPASTGTITGSVEYIRVNKLDSKTWVAQQNKGYALLDAGYDLNFNGSSIYGVLGSTYTTVSGDVITAEVSKVSGANLGVIFDSDVNDANRIAIVYNNATGNIEASVGGPATISVDGGGASFSADGIIRTVEVSGITAGREIAVLGARFDGGAFFWDGVIQSLKITNGSNVKHEFVINRNDNTFIDIQNPNATSGTINGASPSDYSFRQESGVIDSFAIDTSNPVNIENHSAQFDDSLAVNEWIRATGFATVTTGSIKAPDSSNYDPTVFTISQTGEYQQDFRCTTATNQFDFLPNVATVDARLERIRFNRIFREA